MCKEDLADLLDLYKQYQHDVPPMVADDKETLLLWEDILSDPRLHYFVGLLGNRIVSSCFLVIIPNLARGGRPYGLIENVITHQDYRKKGYGTSLLKHALNVAWKNDCFQVMLLTGNINEKVFRFYEKIGFKRGVKEGFVAIPQD